MKFATSAMGSVSVEFLCSNEFQALPYKASANTKAGAVVTYDGITGLCLYDITIADDPNGAILVEGIVDEKKVKACSGASSITAEQKAAMPRITFRNNVGVNS